MANFFSDLYNTVTNQQGVPQQTIIPTSELLNQTYGTLNNQVAPGLVGFNQALAPGLTDVQLGVTNQIDPSILSNFRGANRSILDQLNLGTQMDPALQAEITRNLLATNTASGFGASAGGVGNVQYQTAIDKMNLLRQRQQDALASGTTGLGVSSNIYNPSRYTGLGAELASQVGGDIRQVQAAQDEVANLTEDIRRKNFSALLNTGGRIIGTVAGGIVGAYTGNAAGGAIAGGEIGGRVFGSSGVGGRNQQQQPQSSGGGGGGGMSMLSGLFSGGGGGGSANGAAGAGVSSFGSTY